MSSSVATGDDVAGAKDSRQPHAPATLRPKKRTNYAPLWLLSPAGIVFIVVTVAPILFLIFISFTNYNQRSLFTGAFKWVGVEQYSTMFRDPEFWASLVRTIVFTAAMVGGSIAIGMAISQLLTRVSGVMRYVMTIVLIFAWAMPTVASSVVWNWLFQPGYGVMNWLLTQLRVFGDMTNVSWSHNTTLAYISIWLLVVWQAVPFIALTLYAAQTQVPIECLEAARLDGASEWRIYWSMTARFLQPTLLLVTILSIMWDFNVFNQIWLVSQGGPGTSTSTLGVWTYKKAFVGFDLGQGAAISVVTTVLLMIFTAFYIRNLVRSGEDL